ncbi:MAG TPA: IPT/TIG domain-containing protein, partial [Streptosporangiaceae bacterium]
PVPAVTVVTPDSGSVDGGDTVTITGSGFISVTDVDFGGTSAQFKVDSDGQITATSPAGGDTVHITVVNRAGASATSPADQFYYYDGSCCTSDGASNSPRAAQASP